MQYRLMQFPGGVASAWLKDRTAADLAFVVATILAGGIFWIAPRPPMSDLAQHVAQIALWRDLSLGTSKWGYLVDINYFTPYLVPYAIALPLSFLVPATTAVKLTLTLAFYGFVYSCVFLRRDFGGDRRLDWMFLPCFFGHAYVWGFYPFLVAAPIGLFVMALAHRYASRPSVRLGAALLVLDTGLFFSHGLVFLFANLAGGVFLLLERRRIIDFLVVSLPYVLLLILCCIYTALNLSHEKMAPELPEWMFFSNVRLKFPLYALSAGFSPDTVFIPALVLLFCSPILLGSRLNRGDRTAVVPLAIIGLIALLVPAMAFTTAHIFQRFAIFLLPAYAFSFQAPNPARDAPGRIRRLPLRQLALPVLCLGVLGMKASQAAMFVRESADFEEVLAVAEPASRAMMIILDGNSPATGSLVAYNNYALWYQVEKQGFVDMNIAKAFQMVVHFRPGMLPPVSRAPVLMSDFEWNRFGGEIYRYFFVRHTDPIPERFFTVSQCRVTPVKSAGKWSLYENKGC